MSATRHCRSDSHAVAAVQSSEVLLGPPPEYDDICCFIAEYSGRLPHNVFVGTAPYEYSGCDYALVLYAIMPSKCIDLSRLCWSTTPLPAQLGANLAVFCEAARGLHLGDAPSSLLHPHRLRSTASCIVYHIRVQHWLFVLSQRFLPDKHFDAATLRMKLRHAQLGKPYLRVPVAAATTAKVSSSSSSSSKLFSSSADVTTIQALPLSSLHCLAVWNAAAFEPKPSYDGPPETRGARKELLDAESETQQISSRKYARPWRTAAVTGTAKATTTSRHVRKAQPLPHNADAATTAVPQTMGSLAQQWDETEGRRLKIKRTLAHARDTAQLMLFHVGTIDFDSILSILHQKSM